MGPQFVDEQLAGLRNFLREEAEVEVFPPPAQRLRAFELTSFDEVRVVILGQDPYHGPGQAHGLAFSVPKGVKPPPSLRNILKELSLINPPHGDLRAWARQGVLLLNTVLTVRAGDANSHRNRGWERFTDEVIHTLSEGREELVFLLWGAAAIKKSSLIDAQRHLVLTAPHPSPLSAYRGFFGCGHFIAVNAHLESLGRQPIDWSLSP